MADLVLCSHVETTCSAQTTETVFITVFPAGSSLISPLSSLTSTETENLSTSTILPESGSPGITVTTYDQSVSSVIPSITKTSSVGPAISTSGTYHLIG